MRSEAIMKDPLVSVILTAYNAESFIKDSIESVLAQTWKNFELLIYNDGSADGTLQVIESFTDPRIRHWSSEKNRHIAYGTNFLLSKCTGDYIAIIDADDRWKPEKLEKQISFLKENPSYDCCFSWCDIIDENGAVCNDAHPDYYELFRAQTHTREHWLRYFFFHGNKLCNPSAVFTSSSCKAVGPHNLFYIQATDFEWWVRFTKKYSFAVIEEPLVLYRANFSDANKTSRNTETTVTRYTNELACIRMHFFDDMEDDLFVSSFRECFVNKDSASPDELFCEKLLLSLTPYSNSHAYAAAGMFRLEAAMADPKISELLAEKYGLTTSKAGEYSGTHILNDIILQNSIKENNYLKNVKKLDDISITHYRESARRAFLDKQEVEDRLKKAEVLAETLREAVKIREAMIPAINEGTQI